MTQQREPRTHDWTFVGAVSTYRPSDDSQGGVVPVVVAVCKACGTIRSEPAIVQMGAAIDLRGACSGR